MKHLIRPLSVLLIAVMLLAPLASCAGRNGKTLMTLNYEGTKVTLSVNFYRFQLSRLKGSFVGYGTTKNGVGANDASFWSIQDKFDGSDRLQTQDEYYRAQVLETCKIYLIGLWYFKKEGLSLSETAKENIQQELDDLVADYGNGSKTKLNAVLAPFGMNYRLLKDAYETEAKLETVQDYLYGANAATLGENVKNEYLNSHYLRFKQILIAKYEYEYIKDVNGDTVYYDESGNILYDETYGYTHKDGNGNPVTDENSKTVYFLSEISEKIKYDKVNGSPKYKTDANGNVIRRELSEEELAAVKSDAEATFSAVSNATDDVFESRMLSENGESQYTDGYYLLRDTDYTAISSDLAYLSQIAEMLDSMTVGQTEMIESNDGYHIIRRYTPTNGAYDMEANEVWFSTFADGLMAELFLKNCDLYLSQIAVNESVNASVPSIADIEPNYYF